MNPNVFLFFFSVRDFFAGVAMCHICAGVRHVFLVCQAQQHLCLQSIKVVPHMCHLLR